MLIKTQKQQQQTQAKQQRHAMRSAPVSRLLPKHRDELTDTEFSDIVSSVVFKQ